MRMIAEGRSLKDIAAKFDVTEAGVRKFAERHAEEIAHIKANLEDEFAGLLYARKAERLAEYENDVAIANEEIDKVREGRIGSLMKLRGEQDDDATHEIEVVADISDSLARLKRGKHRALRSIAEELGQLPSRVIVSTDEGAKVRHIVEGVDMSRVMGLGNPDAAKS